MGCFSFKCIECGDGIESDSFRGQNVHLFLLKRGKVLQKMTGAYNSYGSVFINGTQRKDVKHWLRESREWKSPDPEAMETQAFKEKAKIIGEEHSIWHQVCDLMNSEDFTDGIAAVHVKCFKKIPKHRSARDPNQGWGGTYHDRLLGKYDALKDMKIDQLEEQIWRQKDRLKYSDLSLAISRNSEPAIRQINQLENGQIKKTLDSMLKEYKELTGKDYEEKP